MAERQAVTSGCKATLSNPWADLVCHLWPHAGDPTSVHWDADVRVWWQSEDEHVAAATAHRKAAEEARRG